MNSPPTGRFYRTDVVTQKIVEILAPFVGPNMAKASVGLQLQKIGHAGEMMSAVTVEELLGKLRPGLAVFVGTAKADEAAAAMKQALSIP